MEKSSTKKVVIKIGTNVITKDNGFLDGSIMKRLITQVAELKKEGWAVVIVSSGAMGAGRSVIKLSDKGDSIIDKQVLASVGQATLINTYSKFLQNHRLKCSQILVTKEDFRDRRHYLNIKNCLEALLQYNIVPIINENDTVAVSELMFTDNDELAVLVASMIDANKLVMLTSVDGLYRQSADGQLEVIPVIKPGDSRLFLTDSLAQKSKFGRGGILTKVKMARRAANLGITTFIANGRTQNILLDVLSNQTVGTKFLPQSKPSGVKKWVASSTGQEKGTIYINQGAVEALTSAKVASLLPVGVVKIKGNFAKGDIVRIKNERGQNIGVGVAQYGFSQAKKLIGRKGAKPLIHYDYLFLES